MSRQIWRKTTTSLNYFLNINQCIARHWPTGYQYVTAEFLGFMLSFNWTTFHWTSGQISRCYACLFWLGTFCSLCKWLLLKSFSQSCLFYTSQVLGVSRSFLILSNFSAHFDPRSASRSFLLLSSTALTFFLTLASLSFADCLILAYQFLSLEQIIFGFNLWYSSACVLLVLSQRKVFAVLWSSV